MHIYTARQAILNGRKNVVAYELLFRESADNFFPDIDAHEATSKLILRTHLNDGILPITSGKPALINFSQQSLLKGLPLMLPQKQVMIEILETVEPNDQVLQVCRHLFHQGYSLALDDFIFEPQWQKFFNYIKLVKIDLMATPLDSITGLIHKLKQRKNIKLLAEKVETEDEFKQAKEMGFNFFQGYFFCKPEMCKRADVEGNQIILLQLYQEVMRTPLRVNKLSQFFEHDVGLSYKLLRFINSGIVPIKQEISSIKQALVYLGEHKTRQFIALITTAMLAESKPKELIRMAVVRAKFCELAAKKIAPAAIESAFLVGLFSLLDAILNKPMDEILSSLKLSEEICTALDEKSHSTLSILLQTVKIYEQGHWHLTEQSAQKIGLNYKQLADFFQTAVAWTDEFEQVSTGSKLH